MSGAHRNSSYRKALQTATAPPLSSTHLLARVCQSRGGNILEITLPNLPEPQLALLPSKFKNLIWVKRNDYLVVTAASETGGDDKVKVNYLVEHICTKSDNLHYFKSGSWPSSFSAPTSTSSSPPPPSGSGTSSDGIVYSSHGSNVETAPTEEYEEGYEDEEGEFETIETDMSGLMMNTNRRKKNIESESESDSD
ncbi:hypothetical protein TrVE_jg5589 [Triparma verrucosa]|uniref:S1-like domain-containing protein n=1 Tax=Triparma verrucosa TaxID=1606542 RepID=A0A9W7BDH6_9STRA|nr:hypothetical protein TrVE_jg5589 [Triparma verrucosa]